MKFPNQSKSLLPISRNTLKALCAEFGKDPRTITDRGAVNEDNYRDYVRDITMFEPCPICNGPRGPVVLSHSRMKDICWGRRFRTFTTKSIVSHVRCLRYPIHSIILASSDPLSNWGRVSINLCNHGFYFVECRECHKNLKEVQVEQIAAVV